MSNGTRTRYETTATFKPNARERTEMRDLVRIPTLESALSTATFNLAAPRFYPSCHPEQSEGSRLNHEGQLRRDPSAGPQDDIAIGLCHRPMISVDFQCTKSILTAARRAIFPTRAGFPRSTQRSYRFPR